MNKKERVQQKIMFWFEHRYDQFIKSDRMLDIFGWFHDRIQSTICFFYGHSPTADQCNKPEHDFCLWCMKLTPNMAKRGGNMNR